MMMDKKGSVTNYLGGSGNNYVVPDNYQVNNENMMQDLLGDRLNTVKILLINISYEIKLRSEIEVNIKKKIQEDICSLRSKLFSLGAIKTVGRNFIKDAGAV